MHSLPKSLFKFFWYFYKKQPIAFTTFFLAPCLLILEAVVIPYGLKMMVDVFTNAGDDRSHVFQQLSSALWV
jgi:ATP-binding cassette, subfamily B, bacterial